MTMRGTGIRLTEQLDCTVVTSPPTSARARLRPVRDVIEGIDAQNPEIGSDARVTGAKG